MSDTSTLVDIKSFTKEDFEAIGCDYENKEKLHREAITYWADAWRRFRKNKTAMFGAALLILLILFTVVGPYLTPYSYEAVDSKNRNQLPNSEHWFGTDNLGRDLFARQTVGGRVSMIIGIAGALIVVSIGTIYGSVSGYIGGKTDDIMMRIVEIITSIPYLVLVILISLILGRGVFSIIIAMTISGWGGTARMIRGQTLLIKESEYVLTSRALGGNTLWIFLKHILPNVIGILIVNISFAVPGFIFGEAFLSYIGIGIEPPGTSWGALASAAQQKFMFYPLQLFYPAMLISLTMFGFNLVGDGLNDSLDPKLRS